MLILGFSIYNHTTVTSIYNHTTYSLVANMMIRLQVIIWKKAKK